MTRSGAPFHGAHGEGRSAISPAASQAGAARLAPARPPPREPEGMRRQSATTLSLQPQLTGVLKALAIPGPCRARRHNWLKSWQKSIGHADFGCAAALKLEARSDQARCLRVPPAAALTALSR